MKIGLLGFGVVGRGVYDILAERKDISVGTVLCRRDLGELTARTTRDMADIIADPEIDTVVEVMGGLHPAFEYVSEALKAGKNVVTSNKHLLCHYYQELNKLAKEHGAVLRGTAAVGGGIPWLVNLERAARVDRISKLSGIMNGTTNYIMDAMNKSDVDFADVLKKAQELGYAEADPSADIDGWDIQRKLIISAGVAFGVCLQEEDVQAFRQRGGLCGAEAARRGRAGGGGAGELQPHQLRERICRQGELLRSGRGPVSDGVQRRAGSGGHRLRRGPLLHRFVPARRDEQRRRAAQILRPHRGEAPRARGARRRGLGRRNRDAPGERGADARPAAEDARAGPPVLHRRTLTQIKNKHHIKGVFKMKSYKLGILGASGAVGQEMMKILAERKFPIEELHLFASARSAGKVVSFQGKDIVVEEAKDDAFQGLDIVLGAAENDIAERFAPAIVKSGAVFVDNSSAFRLDPNVPLVVPEVNPEDVKKHNGIISNPNCSTVITVTAVNALRKLSDIKSMVVSTYQAVSGAGAAGPVELENEVKALAAGESYQPKVFSYQIAYNVIPQIGGEEISGYTSEEMKLQNEGRKIMHLPEMNVSCTCVRVPVVRSHSISAQLVFDRPISVEEAREAIAAAPGVKLVDDLDALQYPMPLDTQNQDLVFVGRIRPDLTNENGLCLWCCGDQVRKGAATNAIQIAELLIAE